MAIKVNDQTSGGNGVKSEMTLHSASPRGERSGAETGSERDGEGVASLEKSVEQVELVVVGCGTDGAGDDAVGLEIVRRVSAPDRLEQTFNAPDETASALNTVASRSSYLLFVDSVSTTSRPGTIHLVSLPSDIVHPRNLDPAAIPPGVKAALLGIEIDSATDGALSEAVSRAADFVVANIESIERQVLTHEHDQLPLAIHILAPEKDFEHA